MNTEPNTCTTPEEIARLDREAAFAAYGLSDVNGLDPDYQRVFDMMVNLLLAIGDDREDLEYVMKGLARKFTWACVKQRDDAVSRLPGMRYYLARLMRENDGSEVKDQKVQNQIALVERVAMEQIPALEGVAEAALKAYEYITGEPYNKPAEDSPRSSKARQTTAANVQAQELEEKLAKQFGELKEEKPSRIRSYLDSFRRD